VETSVSHLIANNNHYFRGGAVTTLSDFTKDFATNKSASKGGGANPLKQNANLPFNLYYSVEYYQSSQRSGEALPSPPIDLLFIIIGY
jgi:hypothetical protein